MGNQEKVEDKVDDINKNDNKDEYKGIDNKNGFKIDDKELASSNNTSFLKKFERRKIRRKSKKLMKNFVKREEIFYLYNNPLFFGVTFLYNSVILNKDKNEETKKSEFDNNKNIEITQNDVIIETKIKKKKKKKKKKNKKRKENPSPIVIFKNEKINNNI